MLFRNILNNTPNRAKKVGTNNEIGEPAIFEKTFFNQQLDNLSNKKTKEDSFSVVKLIHLSSIGQREFIKQVFNFKIHRNAKQKVF
jgi:hypothetical protein